MEWLLNRRLTLKLLQCHKDIREDGNRRSIILQLRKLTCRLQAAFISFLLNRQIRSGLGGQQSGRYSTGIASLWEDFFKSSERSGRPKIRRLFLGSLFSRSSALCTKESAAFSSTAALAGTGEVTSSRCDTVYDFSNPASQGLKVLT